MFSPDCSVTQVTNEISGLVMAEFNDFIRFDELKVGEVLRPVKAGAVG